MIKKLLSDLINILGNYPGFSLMGIGLLYAILELLEGRSFMKVLDSSSFYHSIKSIFFTFVFLLVIGSFVYQTIFVEIDKFKKTAKRLDLNYHLKNHPDADKLLHTPILRRGERRYIVSPILSGSYNDTQILVFNYRYGQTESAGDSYSFYFRSIVAFSVRGQQVPEFLMLPAQLGDRFFETIFGSDNLHFEEDQEFSRRYKVKGPDREALINLFGLGLRQTLKKSQAEWAAGVTDDYFVIFRDGKTDDRIDSEEFTDYLNEAYMIYQAALTEGRAIIKKP